MARPISFTSTLHYAEQFLRRRVETLKHDALASDLHAIGLRERIKSRMLECKWKDRDPIEMRPYAREMFSRYDCKCVSIIRDLLRDS